MEVTLTDGARIRVRWKYDKHQAQAPVSNKTITKLKKAIYSLNISLQEKRDLCDKIVTEEARMSEVTTCLLLVDDKVISEASITRWFKDADNKPLARKKTFEAAVEKLIAGDIPNTKKPLFDKEDRKLLWAEYLLKVRLPQNVPHEEKLFNLIVKM